jgi:membrane-bound lytic murein transglycosylase B
VKHWPRLTAGIVALSALTVAVALIASSGKGRAHRSSASRPSAALLPTRPPGERIELAGKIDRAQQIIDNPSSTSSQLASAGFFQQLATQALGGETTQLRRETVAMLSHAAAASVHTDLAAAAALSEIVAPERSLPRWQIVEAPAPNKLLGYFREGQARFGVPWQDLAAIELVETRFGRIQGASPAGAQGPMQFLPATWRRYGSGDVGDRRDAILAAAHYLTANGAPGDMAGALYRYDESDNYVQAVEDYAARMREDARAYYGYYYWQVLYRWRGVTVLLPEGYPKAPPVSTTEIPARG